MVSETVNQTKVFKDINRNLVSLTKAIEAVNQTLVDIGKVIQEKGAENGTK